MPREELRKENRPAAHFAKTATVQRTASLTPGVGALHGKGGWQRLEPGNQIRAQQW